MEKKSYNQSSAVPKRNRSSQVDSKNPQSPTLPAPVLLDELKRFPDSLGWAPRYKEPNFLQPFDLYVRYLCEIKNVDEYEYTIISYLKLSKYEQDQGTLIPLRYFYYFIHPGPANKSDMVWSATTYSWGTKGAAGGNYTPGGWSPGIPAHLIRYTRVWDISAGGTDTNTSILAELQAANIDYTLGQPRYKDNVASYNLYTLFTQYVSEHWYHHMWYSSAALMCFGWDVRKQIQAALAFQRDINFYPDQTPVTAFEEPEPEFSMPELEVRPFMAMDFFATYSIWIPQQYKIEGNLSQRLWEQFPEVQAKYILLWQHSVPNTDVAAAYNQYQNYVPGMSQASQNARKNILYLYPLEGNVLYDAPVSPDDWDLSTKRAFCNKVRSAWIKKGTFYTILVYGDNVGPIRGKTLLEVVIWCIRNVGRDAWNKLREKFPSVQKVVDFIKNNWTKLLSVGFTVAELTGFIDWLWDSLFKWGW